MADGKNGKTGLRRYSFTLAFLAFILSLYSYFSFVAYAGFWDGYMSEQELRQIRLPPISTGAASSWGAGLFASELPKAE